MRVLQLTSYLTDNPTHGGQLRCANIATELRRAGHEVMSVAVYVEQPEPSNSPDDISFGPASGYWDSALPWLADYQSGLFAELDPVAFDRLFAVSKKFGPDVIISEHPWLFKAAQKLANGTAKVIHSSHNVEWRLKERVLSRFGIAGMEREKLVSAIRETEFAAFKEADMTVACTVMDAEYYKAEAEKSNHSIHVVVVGNAVEPFSCAESRVRDWRHVLRHPTPVFVSSAHPPNISGFWDMMAPGLTFLRPEERVLIIGSASPAMLHYEGAKDFFDVNARRLNLAGLRDKFELQALVSASHVVLLPITEGEGSNLKTAEALESGNSIVGTSKAFRGFEAARSLRHVHIADDPETFRRTVRRLLDAPRYTGGTPYEIRHQYYWQQQLRPLIEALSSLESIWA